MSKTKRAKHDFPSVEIAGQRYFLVPEPDLEQLTRSAGRGQRKAAERGLSDFAVDDLTLAQRLRRRREEIGLTQLDLATQAGLRHETLNRIERGKTTPDFRTIRKLVIAIDNIAATKG